MHPLARKDEIILAHGSQAVRLRPSLRAAIQLERLHDGWPALVVKLDELDSATLHAMVRAAATDWKDAETFLASLADLPLVEIKAVLLAPLSELLALFLAPTSDETLDTTSAKPMAWDRAYAELFRIGTAVLGWSPAETWAATPTEIVQALDAKITHLNAMNGITGPSDQSDPLTGETVAAKLREIAELGFDPEFDRDGLARLRALNRP